MAFRLESGVEGRGVRALWAFGCDLMHNTGATLLRPEEPPHPQAVAPYTLETLQTLRCQV